MLPFQIQLHPGESLSEQIVYAVKKAIISGQLRPGDKFPSVRVISQELKINPNTAHKVVKLLEQKGLLASTPGIGTVVLPLTESSDKEKAVLLEGEIDRVVIEAKRLGIHLTEILTKIESRWSYFQPKEKK